ncbi:hypothetical protein D3C80_2081080 [compost metagenome]
MVSNSDGLGIKLVVGLRIELNAIANCNLFKIEPFTVSSTGNLKNKVKCLGFCCR